MPSFVEVLIDTPLSEQLETLPDLGTDVVEGGFCARVADQPIGYSVRGLFGRLNESKLDEIRLYKRFELWLVPHRLSILRRSGLAEPTSVGIEVRYENDGRTCSVVSLFPSFEYISHGHIAGEFGFKGKMSTTGDIAPTADTGEALNQAKIGSATAGIAAGADLALQLSASVCTPSISAVGVGSTSCEWRLNKQKEPLFGKDIETWSVLALPKRQRELRYQMRFYFTARTLFFQTRRQSDWLEVGCQLTG